MNIAVITGASSGLGIEFVKAVADKYPSLDEIWLVARRKERLEAVAEKITALPCRAVVCDITSKRDLDLYRDMLTNYGANVKILINNAGFGKLGYFEEIDLESTAGMVCLNCEALSVMTHITLEYMNKNAQIINVCSIASFVPNARMAVYSSTKAYVMSFSRALRYELKRRSINVLAVCPGPMDTEFLAIADIPKGASKTFDTLPRVNPTVCAVKALEASKKGKAVYTNRLFYKFYRFLSRVVPHRILMKASAT